MSRVPLSRAARRASFGISMPMISRAGETMRALMPAMRPLCWSSTFSVSPRLMLLSAMMSGIVASPVWQMWRKGTISVWQLGMMCRGNAPKVAEPALPASTMVVTPASTPPRSGLTPVRLTPSKTWACRSIKPGVTTLPPTAMVRAASVDGMSGAMRAICPPSTAMSCTPSSPADGSTTVPPLSKRSYMAWPPGFGSRFPAHLSRCPRRSAPAGVPETALQWPDLGERKETRPQCAASTSTRI